MPKKLTLEALNEMVCKGTGRTQISAHKRGRIFAKNEFLQPEQTSLD